MKPTFPGILGREFARVDKTARALRPGSVPGVLVSRTTQGVLLKPIRQPSAPANHPIQVTPLLDYPDWLLCVDDSDHTYEVLKPAALRTDYGSDYHSVVTSGYVRQLDFLWYSSTNRFVLAESSLTPPPGPSGPFSVDMMVQVIWAPYFKKGADGLHTEGRPIWIQAVKPTTVQVREQIEPSGLGPASPREFRWIDLNTDARRWEAVSKYPFTGEVTTGATTATVPLPITLATDDFDTARAAVQYWLNGHIHALEDAVYGSGHYIWTPPPR